MEGKEQRIWVTTATASAQQGRGSLLRRGAWRGRPRSKLRTSDKGAREERQEVDQDRKGHREGEAVARRSKKAEKAKESKARRGKQSKEQQRPGEARQEQVSDSQAKRRSKQGGFTAVRSSSRDQKTSNRKAWRARNKEYG
mmetsp:Transcript_29136/g.45661  ORF Transcript_29136/g.45661 Transcript_29136/m.45661 type:complete len:141 (+) Transcript_29136:376-798(+)